MCRAKEDTDDAAFVGKIVSQSSSYHTRTLLVSDRRADVAPVSPQLHTSAQEIEELAFVMDAGYAGY